MSRVGSRPPSRDLGSRRSSKAKYHPLVGPQTNNVGKTESRHTAQNKPTLSGIPETPASAFTGTFQPRNWWCLPDDHDLAVFIQARQSYLKQTGIEESFTHLCTLLLLRPELPYNPYPGFVRRIRSLLEKFPMFLKSDREVVTALNNPVKESHIPGICRPVYDKTTDGIWALPSIIQAVDPVHLSKYDWLLKDLTPKRFTVEVQGSYSNQIMVGLVGPTVFNEINYQFGTGTINVMVQYLIMGSQLEEAMNLFVKSVTKDVLSMFQQTKHLAIGVRLPGENEAPDSSLDLWDLNLIQDRKLEFEEAIKENITAKQPIILECVAQLSESVHHYQPLQKMYTLVFVEVDELTGEEKEVSTFKEYPMLMLHEGVFMNRIHMESYMAAFYPTSVIDEEYDAQDLSGATDGNSSGDIAVDGFRYGSDINYTPYAWQIVMPIKGHLQKAIVGSHTELDLLNIAYHALILVLLDRSAYEDKLLWEVYRLLRSSGARLAGLQEVNRCLQAALHVLQSSRSSLVQHLFVQYTNGLKDLLANEFQEYCSDITTAGLVIQYKLAKLSRNFNQTQTLSNIKQMLSVLQEIYSYCKTIQLLLNEAALDLSPQVQELITTLRDSLPEEIPRPQTRVRDRRDMKKTGVRAGEGEQTFLHGVEDETIIKHERLVVNQALAREKGSSPSVIATDSVLLKYLLDAHVDEIWAQFLVELLSGLHLPANPYPQLSTAMRKAAMRMDLCFESLDRLREKIVHGAVRVEDPDNHVSHIPGCDVHGLLCALSVLDTAAFFKLIPTINQFMQTNFIQKKGAFRVALCCCVSGHAGLIGQVNPYLLKLILDEHCYIRGPPGCATDAMQIYSKIVYEHVVGLHHHEQTPVIGITLGDKSSVWNIHDILSQKKAFAFDLERHLTKKQPLVLKVYALLGWRFVCVKKRLCFHYITSDDSQNEVFFPEDPAAFYQNIFLDKAKAAFHFQYGGPTDRSDPFSIINVRLASHSADQHISEAAEKQDWLNVHRWLLTKTLMQRGQSHVGEAWRMLHSIAGQLEYVIELGRSLQDLTQYVLNHFNQGSHPQSTDSEAEVEITAEKVGSVDLGLLGRMAMAFRQKSNQVLKNQIAMAPKSMAKVIEMKLQQITERDEITQEIFLIIKKKTVTTLFEVCTMMQCVQDMTATDVQAVSPEAQSALKVLHAELSSQRPHSFHSLELTEQDTYPQLPKAN